MTSQLQVTELLIDGKQVPAADGRSFTVVGPSNGTTIAQVAPAGKADMNQAVAAARAAFTAPEWARMPPATGGGLRLRHGRWLPSAVRREHRIDEGGGPAGS